MSQISNELTFLKANKGTAVSKGNSSKPSINRDFLSGASLRHGILVKAEYRYFKSASSAAFALALFISADVPSPKEDHSELIPVMTLLTLDTE